MDKSKALIITNKPIFPSLDGGSVAMRKFTEALIKNYTLDIIAISKTSNQQNKTNQKVNLNEKISQIIFEKKMSLNFLHICKSIINNTSYQANRFYSEKIKLFIQKKIDEEDYKIIIFESIFTTIYLKKINYKKSTKIILRAHNVEHQIWEDLARSHWFKKIVFLLLAIQIKKMELNVPKYVDYIFTLSKNDEVFFKKHFPKKTHNIPVTFKTKEIKNTKIKRSLVYLGAMDWQPNIEGLNWFLKYVLPKVKKRNENLNIYIGGKNMDNKYLKLNDKNTHITSKIDNAEEYIKNKEIMFVPLFSGSGIRIKILESMALGVPVISTTKGAQGIPYRNGEDIIIADNPNDFNNAIHLLINNAQLRQRIALNGQLLIKKHFSQKTVIRQLNEIIK